MGVYRAVPSIAKELKQQSRVTPNREDGEGSSEWRGDYRWWLVWAADLRRDPSSSPRLGMTALKANERCGNRTLQQARARKIVLQCWVNLPDKFLPF